ncbi:CAP domain-containing protein [Catenaria anguillulae PL171]|uniref:CAP domain-containing protein n=1 Tax=Catenaria anguillulae PL171 TaxID=765915 RepID=A0A1Y2HM34_9FUNG|nr:CAP domain-containing protein [Catenaria anguillulae PL171]
MKLFISLFFFTLMSALSGGLHANTGPKLKARSVASPIKFALDQLNTLRASKGLRPLCLNKALQDSAQAHSDWMARQRHPTHFNTFQRMERYGYPGNTLRAENIAVNMNGNAGSNCFGYAPRVRDALTSAAYATNCAWFSSTDGHFENMMNPDFNQVGIAYSIGDYRGRSSYYWTQNFGRSSQPCIDGNTSATPTPGPKPVPNSGHVPTPPKPAPAPIKASPKHEPGNKSMTTPSPKNESQKVDTKITLPKYETKPVASQKKPKKCKLKKKPTKSAAGYLHGDAPITVPKIVKKDD